METKTSIAYSIDNRNDKWHIKCPDCNREYICDGVFDTEDMYTCVECGADFTASKLDFKIDEFK